MAIKALKVHQVDQVSMAEAESAVNLAGEEIEETLVNRVNKAMKVFQELTAEMVIQDQRALKAKLVMMVHVERMVNPEDEVEMVQKVDAEDAALEATQVHKAKVLPVLTF